MAWVGHGRKRIEHLVKECYAEIGALLPDYFVDWKKVVAAECLDSYALPGPDNPDFVTGLMQYISGQAHRQPTMRAHLSEEDKVRLHALEMMAEEKFGA